MGRGPAFLVEPADWGRVKRWGQSDQTCRGPLWPCSAGAAGGGGDIRQPQVAGLLAPGLWGCPGTSSEGGPCPGGKGLPARQGRPAVPVQVGAAGDTVHLRSPRSTHTCPTVKPAPSLLPWRRRKRQVDTEEPFLRLGVHRRVGRALLTPHLCGCRPRAFARGTWKPPTRPLPLALPACQGGPLCSLGCVSSPGGGAWRGSARA